jgi:5-methyltetrahydropteroyltriglutamate--homocysteine methyltransferase
VQIDEPALVLDLDYRAQSTFGEAYAILALAVPAIQLLLTTYFGGLGDNLQTALTLSVADLHLDLVRAPDQLDTVLAKAPGEPRAVVVCDRRPQRLARQPACSSRQDRTDRRGTGRRGLDPHPSCSLLHVPVDPRWK